MACEAHIYSPRSSLEKNWLSVLSTDISITDEEVIRIYGKRWDVEVFF
jgi:hypothetical protein